MRRLIDQRYGSNLATGAHFAGSRDGEAAHSARAIADGDTTTFLPVGEGPDGMTAVLLPHAVTFDRIVLQEPIALGQRVARFRVEVWNDGAWQQWAQGTTIGYKRILAAGPVTTDRIRLTVLDARGQPPLLAELGLYDTGQAGR
jgi:alpha-L-fucosidase